MMRPLGPRMMRAQHLLVMRLGWHLSGIYFLLPVFGGVGVSAGAGTEPERDSLLAQELDDLGAAHEPGGSGRGAGDQDAIREVAAQGELVAGCPARIAEAVAGESLASAGAHGSLTDHAAGHGSITQG